MEEAGRAPAVEAGRGCRSHQQGIDSVSNNQRSQGWTFLPAAQSTDSVLPTTHPRRDALLPLQRLKPRFASARLSLLLLSCLGVSEHTASF